MTDEREWRVDVLEELQEGTKRLVAALAGQEADAYDQGVLEYLESLATVDAADVGDAPLNQILADVAKSLGVEPAIDEAAESISLRESGVRGAQSFCVGYAEGLSRGFELAAAFASEAPGVASESRRA